ncbi:MAG: penicillin-binding protein 1A, partial [Pseudomonadota bacterium]|nr:penicillin-binding protein 1A [Pseudomonadota bacterium]
MRTIFALLLFMIVASLVGAGAVTYGLYQVSRDLPDYRQLTKYDPPVVTRVHAGNGRLLAEFAREKRVFVPIGVIPRRVIDAFLAAEDKNFYKHPGLDWKGITRATLVNLKNLGTDKRPVGASTITQQVAKNFLLTGEVSYERKIKEAILSLRIEHAYGKNRILELYLNEIYLGFGSYGVAAAALNYFDKSLAELTIAEAAYLAALPKAPNNYHPIRHRKAALGRRNWVIGRMIEDERITASQGAAAKIEDLVTRNRSATEFVPADYFTEEVRRELLDLYGEHGLYDGGLSVRTTIDPDLQDVARRALTKGLIDYDRRHGWRGPLDHWSDLTDWQTRLATITTPKGAGDNWQAALVLDLNDMAAQIGLADGTMTRLPMAELTWARSLQPEQKLGPKIENPADVLKIGDIVLAAPSPESDPVPDDGFEGDVWRLHQVPDIEGAAVVLNPHTGRVLAMVGGLSHGKSQFNRVTQARRQPGSAFKPIVYLAALESGFTPSDLILDAPFVMEQGPDKPKWRPENYSNVFYGPTPLRVGIEKSRNLMTVRLAEYIGMETIDRQARLFGVSEHLPRQLSMALGAGETTLLRLTAAYATIDNGGKKIVPTLIDRIQNKRGRTLFRHDDRDCPGCTRLVWQQDLPVPDVPDTRQQLVDPRAAYQVVSMLEGVIERGTGWRVNAIGKPLAGKTGTTNDNKDAWFIGFS